MRVSSVMLTALLLVAVASRTVDARRRVVRSEVSSSSPKETDEVDLGNEKRSLNNVAREIAEDTEAIEQKREKQREALDTAEDVKTVPPIEQPGGSSRPKAVKPRLNSDYGISVTLRNHNIIRQCHGPLCRTDAESGQRPPGRMASSSAMSEQQSPTDARRHQHESDARRAHLEEAVERERSRVEEKRRRDAEAVPFSKK